MTIKPSFCRNQRKAAKAIDKARREEIRASKADERKARAIAKLNKVIEATEDRNPPLVWREPDIFKPSMKGIGKRRGVGENGAPRYSRSQLAKMKARGGRHGN